MFYYYGAKHRLSRYYPEPKCSTIVEPFAGAAGYAMFWLEKRPDMRAVLVEKDPRVADTWRRVLRGDVNIDRPEVGEWTTDFLCMTASASNATGTLKRMRFSERASREFDRMLRRIRRIASAVAGRVEIIEGDFTCAPDIEATWFIDPPYKPTRSAGKTSRAGGRGYARGCNSDSLDYSDLANFCRSRRGQVIACEYVTADWLEFSPLRENQDAFGRKYTEGVWIREAKGRSGMDAPD